MLHRQRTLLGELSYRPGLTQDSGALTPVWKALLVEMPDRFLVGSEGTLALVTTPPAESVAAAPHDSASHTPLYMQSNTRDRDVVAAGQRDLRLERAPGLVHGAAQVDPGRALDLRYADGPAGEVGQRPAVMQAIELELPADRFDLDDVFVALETEGDAGVRRVVFASSSSVYGDVAELPLRAAAPIAVVVTRRWARGSQAWVSQPCWDRITCGRKARRAGGTTAWNARSQPASAVPGGSATLKIKRLNIAERLYRVTGQGIYRDSVLLGRAPPLKRPLLNSQVIGSDSVMSHVGALQHQARGVDAFHSTVACRGHPYLLLKAPRLNLRGCDAERQ